MPRRLPSPGSRGKVGPAEESSYCEHVADQRSGESSASGITAVLVQIADAVARAQRGERVTIDSLGIAVVPSEDIIALGATDEEAEESMIELDR
jgi:hypothetical protein